MTTWPDTTNVEPLADHLYRSATWLLGRHPRLAELAARITGVINRHEHDGELSINLTHLGDVFAAAPRYEAAWDDYEASNRPPEDDTAYERWRMAGPKPARFAAGLSCLLVMSSGEKANLRGYSPHSAAPACRSRSAQLRPRGPPPAGRLVPGGPGVVSTPAETHATNFRWFAGVIVLVLLAVLAGCGSAARPSSQAETTPGRGGPLAVAVGHGWTPTGLDGPVPLPGSCHYRTADNGEPLPDPACTPGAIDPAVTQADLGATVCRAGGYTASVRPPEQLTEATKKDVMAAYGVPWSQASHYVVDHLLSGVATLRGLDLLGSGGLGVPLTTSTICGVVA